MRAWFAWSEVRVKLFIKCGGTGVGYFAEKYAPKRHSNEWQCTCMAYGIYPAGKVVPADGTCFI